VLTVWGDDVYVTPHQNPLKGWLARRALRNADAITGDSQDILRACARLGADPRKCFEIVWGVDFERFHPERGGGIRAQFGIPESAPLLFSPRSFTQPYYNIDIIIAAFAEVSQRRPEVHFLFSGYEGDQTPFADRARQAGLSERTHFVGRIPHQRFGDFLAAADVFVSVPSVDATAVSLLEAMACACSIVVSDLPSPREWIEDGVSGRIVPARDTTCLTETLVQLVDDPEQRRRLGREAHRRARERAGFDDNMARAAAIYDRVVAGTLIDTGSLRSTSVSGTGRG
jgi:glycosyltransferase involved in cell wall biosynthesis